MRLTLRPAEAAASPACGAPFDKARTQRSSRTARRNAWCQRRAARRSESRHRRSRHSRRRRRRRQPLAVRVLDGGGAISSQPRALPLATAPPPSPLPTRPLLFPSTSSRARQLTLDSIMSWGSETRRRRTGSEQLRSRPPPCCAAHAVGVAAAAAAAAAFAARMATVHLAAATMPRRVGPVHSITTVVRMHYFACEDARGVGRRSTARRVVGQQIGGGIPTPPRRPRGD